MGSSNDWNHLDNFYKKYNKVLLDKLAGLCLLSLLFLAVISQVHAEQDPNFGPHEPPKPPPFHQEPFAANSFLRRWFHNTFQFGHHNNIHVPLAGTTTPSQAFHYNVPSGPLECKFKDPNSGYEYDFSALTKYKGDFAGSDVNYNYLMNICGPANVGGPCAQHHAAICQYSKQNGNYVASLGSWSTGVQPSWSFIDANNVNKGVMLTYRNGDICWINHMQVVRVANVHLECDESGSTQDTFTIFENYATCSFTIQLRTPLACVGGGKSSFFSHLFWFIIIVGSIYLALGLFINHKYYDIPLGVEAIPHLEFWKACPGYVQEGFEWTYAKAMSYMPKKEGSDKDDHSKSDKEKASAGEKRPSLEDDDDEDLYADAQKKY
jgi:hypothetical protein